MEGGNGEVRDSPGVEPSAPSGPGLRVSETDLAILTAFCRPYLEGDGRFVVPAPNNEILRELAENGVYLEIDALRGHLRNLYAKFGVEDGVNPAQKRARLAELVYEHGVIAGLRKGSRLRLTRGSRRETVTAEHSRAAPPRHLIR